MGNHPFAVRSRGDHLRPVGEHRGGVIVPWVAVGDISADRSPVTDNGIGQHADSVCEKRVFSADESRVVHRGLAGHRANLEPASLLLHVGQAVDAAQIHKQGGRGKPEPHQRDKALPARKDLGILVPSERGDRLGKCLG
jgi:hypothetical protein